MILEHTRRPRQSCMRSCMRIEVLRHIAHWPAGRSGRTAGTLAPPSETHTAHASARVQQAYSVYESESSRATLCIATAHAWPLAPTRPNKQHTHAATGRIYDIHTHIVPSLIRSKQHEQQKRQPTDWWPVRSLWPITSPALAGLAEAALHAGLSKISLSRPLRLAPCANRSDAVRAGARRRHVALGRRLLPARGGAKAPLWHRGVL